MAPLFARLGFSRVAIPTLWCIGLAFAASCGGHDDSKTEPAPTPVRGGERLRWDQGATSIQELRSLTFRLYVDGTPMGLTAPSCGETATDPRYPCSGGLPQMTAGRHVLELSSVLNGVESPRSQPLTVTVNTSTTSSRQFDGRNAVTTCGSVSGAECYEVSTIASGLGATTALTPLPDGRVLLIEQGERIRIIDSTGLAPEPALTIRSPQSAFVGMSADPRFDQTRSVFVAWTGRSTRGALVNVTRYREVQGGLGQGAAIITALPFREGARAPIATDADGLVLLALPADAQRPSARSEVLVDAGVVLRVDRDGLVPRNNVGDSPIIARGPVDPTGLAIDASGKRVWMTGTDYAGRETIATFATNSATSGSWPIRPLLVSDVSSSTDHRPGRSSDVYVIIDAALRRVVARADGSFAISPDEVLGGMATVTAAASAPDGSIFAAVTEADHSTSVLRLRRR